jgi:hypothetical protein
MKCFTTAVFLTFFFSGFSQQADCNKFSDKTQIPSSNSYRIEYIEGSVETRSHLTRSLSCEELWLVYSRREKFEDVVLILDNYTRVIIFKESK